MSGLGNAFSFAFNGLKDKKAWLYALAIFGVWLAYVVVVLLLLAGALGAALASGDLLTLLAEGFAAIASIFFLAVVLAIPAAVAALYLEGLLYVHALRAAGYSPAPFNLNKLLRWILLLILAAVHVLFLLFDVKLLGLVVGLLVLAFLLGAAGVPALTALLALAAVAVYFVAAILHAVRLGMATPIFFANDFGLRKCLKESWRLVKGHTLYVFAAALILSIVAGIAAMIASLVVALPFELVSMAIGSSNLAALLGIALLSRFFQNLVAVPISMIPPIYLYAKLLEQLGRWKGAPPTRPSPTPPEPGALPRTRKPVSSSKPPAAKTASPPRARKTAELDVDKLRFDA